MPGHALRNLDAAAIGKVIGDAGSAKGVTADVGFELNVGGAAARHVPDIGPE